MRSCNLLGILIYNSSWEKIEWGVTSTSPKHLQNYPKLLHTIPIPRSKMVQGFLRGSKISHSNHKQRSDLVIRVWRLHRNAVIVTFSLTCGILSFFWYFHWFRSLYFWKKLIFFGSTKNEATPRPWSLAPDVANMVIYFIIYESENFVPFSTARF